MSSDPTSHPAWWWLLCALALGCLASCGTYEDKRIRELLQEKGFGSRASGDATVENYVGGRDMIQFLVPPEALATAPARLNELTVPQPVALDGTIFVPYVGPVSILGKTEAEAAALVNQQLRTAGIVVQLDIQARIMAPSQKYFYAFGEVPEKGPKLMEPDLTFFDAMNRVGWTPLANIGRVYLIRPDAQHPLTVDINLREMIASGLMASNIAIRERDIIYVPPTFLGMVARLLQRLLEPLNVAVQAAFGLASARTSYDVLRGESNGFYFRY